jgi:hypothetical protein
LSFDDPDNIWQQKIQNLFNINISQFGVFFRLGYKYYQYPVFRTFSLGMMQWI